MNSLKSVVILLNSFFFFVGEKIHFALIFVNCYAVSWKLPKLLMAVGAHLVLIMNGETFENVFLMQYTLMSTCTKSFSTHWTFFLTRAGTKDIFLCFFYTFFSLVRWDSINTHIKHFSFLQKFLSLLTKIFPEIPTMSIEHG